MNTQVAGVAAVPVELAAWLRCLYRQSEASLSLCEDDVFYEAWLNRIPHVPSSQVQSLGAPRESTPDSNDSLGSLPKGPLLA